MIHCEKKPVGVQIKFNGTTRDVVAESLYIIQGVYESFESNGKQEAEAYKKLILSAVLGLDGFCIFDAQNNSVKVDLSALHNLDRNGGDIDGGRKEMPR